MARWVILRMLIGFFFPRTPCQHPQNNPINIRSVPFTRRQAIGLNHPSENQSERKKERTFNTLPKGGQISVKWLIAGIDPAIFT